MNKVLSVALLSVTLTNVNEMGEEMTKVNKWGIWRKKRGKSIVGLKKCRTFAPSKDIRVTQVINSKRANKGTPRRD